MCMLTAIHPQRRLAVCETNTMRLLTTQFLILNALSGNKDGTGIGTLSGQIAKWEEQANAVVCTESYHQAINEIIVAPGEPIIAHVRATSTGVAAKEGAHPFAYNNLLLAHNGTFDNYKKLAKDTNIKDSDPVDSHVITHILGDIVGKDEALTSDHILATLKKVTGSYALLIVDAYAKALWVVRGSSNLHYVQLGPLHVINTSKINLSQVITNCGVTANVCGSGLAWWDDLPESKSLDLYTIYKLTKSGLVKVADIPRPKYTGVTTKFEGVTYYRGNTVNISSPLFDSPAEAQDKAKIVEAILELPGGSEEALSFACQTLFGTEWYKLPPRLLHYLYATWLSVTEHGDPEKDGLWEQISSKCDGDPYTMLDGLVEVEFPYQLNTLPELSGVLETLNAIDDAYDENKESALLRMGGHV